MLLGRARCHRQLGGVAGWARRRLPVHPWCKNSGGPGCTETAGSRSPPRRRFGYCQSCRGGGDRLVVERAATSHAGDERASQLTACFSMGGNGEARTRPWSGFAAWRMRPSSRRGGSAGKQARPRVRSSRPTSRRPALGSGPPWPSAASSQRMPARSSCTSRQPGCRSVSPPRPGRQRPRPRRARPRTPTAGARGAARPGTVMPAGAGWRCRRGLHWGQLAGVSGEPVVLPAMASPPAARYRRCRAVDGTRMAGPTRMK